MRHAFVLILAIMVAPVALAHGGPLPAGDTLATATPVGAPTYGFFEAPSGTSVHYFKFLAAAGETRVRLASPHGQEPDELAVLFIFGPGLSQEVAVPPDVERPEGSGGVAFPANQRDTFDVPALGARWSLLLSRDMAFEEGEYIFALRTQSEGPLALVLEREGVREILEHAMVPALRGDARSWAGISRWPPLVAGGIGVVLVAALAWRARPEGGTRSFLSLTGHASAAFFLASGLALATDAARSGVGWIVIMASIGCAVATFLLARSSPPRPGARHRLLMVLVALVGFWAYAGFVWGPLVAIAGAVLPEPAIERVKNE